MAIQNTYRVVVDFNVDGLDVLHEVGTCELVEDFEKDYIRAVRKSFNDTEDGYCEQIVADFYTKADAEEAERVLEDMAKSYAARWHEYERKRIAEFYEDE